MAHGGPLSLSTARKILGPQGPLSLGAPGVPGALGAQGPWGEKEKSAPLIPTTLAFSRTKKNREKLLRLSSFRDISKKRGFYYLPYPSHVRPSIHPSVHSPI